MVSRHVLIKGLLGVAFFFVVFTGSLLGYVGYWFSTAHHAEAPGKPFVVHPGSSVQMIANRLAEEDVITNPRLFSWVSRALGDATHIHAGEYILSASMTPAGILKKFTDGDVILHRVTLPEGVTSFQFIALLETVPELEGPIDKIPQEGSLLPETYSFIRGMARAGVIQDIQEGMNQLVDQLWAQRPVDCPLSSKEEFVTMASIVEKETALHAERPLVAAVFLNRLKIGMPLQADPTVVYGLTQGKGALGRRLLKVDLKQENPYNTYLNQGLPPGPIANPGKASLEAVINPADVSYLYFVADGEGGHVFSSSLAEHNKNHEKWRKIRRTH